MKSYHRALLAVLSTTLLLSAAPVLSVRDRHATPIVTPDRSCGINTYVQGNVRTMNVRSGPGNKYHVLRALSTGNDEMMISVIGGTGQWLLIEGADYTDNTPPVKVRGWVYAPLFRTHTQGANVKVWSAPSHSRAVIAKLQDEEEVMVTGCQGNWVRVRHPKASGWLDSDSQCGNPVTTCP